MTFESQNSGVFPVTRLRRLRYHPGVRRLTRDTILSPDRFIIPLFVRPGKGIRTPIDAMPGQFQLSLDELVKEVKEIEKLGVGGVMLFGIPEVKDAVGSDAMSDDGIIAQAIRAIKDVVGPEFLVISDVCFCEYTDHGHCGVMKKCGKADDAWDVDNDATLANLMKQTLVQARAGVDMVAPSGMMDGMIAAIRKGFDENGFERLPIMSYSAKYASAFYGPFREAAESAPKYGDRRSYQMAPDSAPGQAMREIALDVEEGADIIMVKPALPYLDVVRMAKDQFPGLPLAAYNVSGEYSMTKAAAMNGWIDEKRVVLETLTSIQRAGATIIITYWAKDVAQWLA
ncbi:MAG: porphobilinogen synthase [Thermoguttaceae bacterium]|nr:porphobilinogen synthase [Thermoguttaceae bacterium]MBQ4204780.1 porphobilinogen synthase [Thermoguttaceae bacterium]